MAEVWVVNASPLITLAKAGQLALLSRLEGRLIVPQAVAHEVLLGAAADPARAALAGGFGAPFVPVQVETEISEWVLGAGESAVLSLARTHDATAILDDRDPRRVAALLRVRHTGTLGIVLQAAKRGWVGSATEVLQKLRESGLYLDDRVVADALYRYLGERWEPWR